MKLIQKGLFNKYCQIFSCMSESGNLLNMRFILINRLIIPIYKTSLGGEENYFYYKNKDRIKVNDVVHCVHNSPMIAQDTVDVSSES